MHSELKVNRLSRPRQFQTCPLKSRASLYIITLSFFIQGKVAYVKKRAVACHADKLLSAIRTHCAIDKSQAELLSQAMDQFSSRLRRTNGYSELRERLRIWPERKTSKRCICLKRFNTVALIALCFIKKTQRGNCLGIRYWPWYPRGATDQSALS